MSYSVVVLEVPTEPTPGTSSTVQIQIGIDRGNVDLVNRWLDRLERQRLIVPGHVRSWETPDDEQTDAQIPD